jgi:prolyl oligopeptidase
MNLRAQFSLLIAASRIAAGLAIAAEPALPPPAPVKPVTDEYFGHKIVDPYRYMEDLKDAGVQTWIKAQADYTAGTLARIPQRDKLLARIHELDTAATARVSNVQVLPGEVVFYEKTLASEDVAKLYVRHGMAGQEKLLLDPARLNAAGGPPHVINYFSASWDGGYVVAGVSEGGSEQAIIHVIDTATGKESPESIDRALFGAVSWKDSNSFFYNRLQKMLPGMPPTEKELKSTMWLHRIGTSVDKDAPVFGFDRSPLVHMEPTDIPLILTTSESPQALGVVMHGLQNEVTLYVAPIASLEVSGGIPWKLLADTGDEITSSSQHGDDLYLVSHKDAPRFKILRTSVSHPDLKNAAVVVPQSSAVITSTAAARDALYVRELDGGIAHLLRVPYSGVPPEEISLPFAGDFSITGDDLRVTGVLVVMSSWVKAPRILRYDPGSKSVTDTGLQPLGKYDDPPDMVSEEMKVPGYDGVLVPLSIVHRKGIPLNGSNPTLLDGYGAYGFTRDPHFNPTLLAWLENGGVFAVAHVRGGGEHGEEWYRAGYKLTKPNTWRDFIACAEYLIGQKYTSSAKLGIQGGSAGGIMIGRSLTERPDLFAAAIDAVGVSDTLRMEFSENGPPNIGEFGSVKTQEGFEDLYAMSSYAHVADHTAYPAIMLTTGINDPRVAPWQVTKMAARLQAATSSGKPILLRVNYEAGHGMGSTKDQLEKESADRWSFLLWQFGQPEFQPLPVP